MTIMLTLQNGIRRCSGAPTRGLFGAMLAGLGLALPIFWASAQSPEEAPATPQESLRRLKDGNARYVANHPSMSHLDHSRIEETEKEQKPFATILACSDSRVPVEHIFDAGIGDLFVVRVAGNVSGEDELGSIEYAVDHLHTPLLVIMGHSHCGAVTAVVEHENLEGHIPRILQRIRPSYRMAQAAHPDASPDQLVEETVRLHVRSEVESLLKLCPDIPSHTEKGHFQVVGAIYDLHSGKVEWLEPSAKPSIAPVAAAKSDGLKGESKKEEQVPEP